MSFLKMLFGSSNQEIWSELAQEIGASYEKSGLRGGSFEVRLKYKVWEIILDKHVVSSGKSSVTYTRIRAPYINKDGFQFTIYREGFWSRIGKALGMEDVEVGFPMFDEDFIIKGNDHHKLWKLFQNEQIRVCFKALDNVRLGVRDKPNSWFKETQKDIDNLHFQVVGIIEDKLELKILFELFTRLLDQLHAINAASDENPKRYQ